MMLATISYVAALTTLLLLPYLWFHPAPYGKHAVSTGILSAIPINAKLAWFVQELPAFLVPLYYLSFTALHLDSVRIALAMFLLHYFNRSCIFPFLVTGGRPTPFATCFSAWLFCMFNGWLQTQSLIEVNVETNIYCVMVGVVVYMSGMWINISADSHLRDLASIRTAGSYLTPTEGMFRYVSAANYFGEIVEWSGYALVAQTPAALWFAFFTLCFLGQRGYQSHLYYLEKIKDYPKDRKAVIPFII